MYSTRKLDRLNDAARTQLTVFVVEHQLRPGPAGQDRTIMHRAFADVLVDGEKFSNAAKAISKAGGALGDFLKAEGGVLEVDRLVLAGRLLDELGIRE